MSTNANAIHEGTATEPTDRAIRAAVESMVVVPNGPGLYEVYSGETSTYVVDVVAETCTCPDHQYRGNKCKHVHRVRQTLGEEPIPEGVRVDSTIRHQRDDVRTDGGVQAVSADPIEATQSTEHPSAALAAIVADSTQFADLPDFDVFRVANGCIQDTIERCTEGER